MFVYLTFFATPVLGKCSHKTSLYRNTVLDAMEDARAELKFLLQESTQEQQSLQADKLDLTELNRLLQDADVALEKWFSLIDERDVKQAKEAL